MRVAIFVGDVKQVEGGAYTFARSVLSALEHAATSSAHEFILLHEGQSAISGLVGSLQHVDLAHERRNVLTRAERVLIRLPNFATRLWSRLSRAQPLPDWRTRALRARGVQFVLSLNQWNSLETDVPFGLVIWDLQHRNNPWFPEVSDAGQWSAREESMAKQCQRAALILTGTRRGAQEIESYYRVSQERIKVLPFCTPQFALDADAKDASAELLRDLSLPPKYVLYPAQFWPHKNHVVILEAMQRLKDLGLGAVFVGSDRGNLEYVRQCAVTLGVDFRTKFLGFVEQRTLVELYKNAFAMVFATYCGPDNLPPLEAFALGCPVIASSVPGAQEQLGEAALFFEPSDSSQLEQQLRHLQDDPSLRQRLVAAGREVSAARTWDCYAASLLTALDDFAKIRRAWEH